MINSIIRRVQKTEHHFTDILKAAQEVQPSRTIAKFLK
jgi:hypothetical protein